MDVQDSHCMATTSLRHLCFFTAPRAYTNSEFGQRLQPMEYGGLICQGTESSLQDCAVSQSHVETWSDHVYCDQGDSAGVRCTPRIYGKTACRYIPTRNIIIRTAKQLCSSHNVLRTSTKLRTSVKLTYKMHTHI